MASTRTKVVSVEQLMAMPTDEPWEVWEGELREVPAAGFDASALAGWICYLLLTFVKPRNLGVVTTADGSYILSYDPLTIVVPDVAFVRSSRLPAGPRPKGYAPFAPDLAIEVRSPTDRRADIDDKLAHYRRAGVPLVWWVDPAQRRVEVYRRGLLVAELSEGNVLDGEDILPGFRLPVAEIFA
ncbi:MAG TPA: Uma2 family endonuclease [Thermomicrobiales bacterium]|jgi:Uma2 family endonuclease